MLAQEGDNDLYPTVYLLWRFPQALEALHTHSEVSPRILGGADLMLQGVIVPDAGLGDFEEHDKRCVALPNNHFPFGVGSMVCSSASLATSGLKGRGLKLLHHYPDAVWAMGDKSVPDPSFTPERVYPLGAAPEAGSAPAPPPASTVADAVQALTLDDENTPSDDASGETQQAACPPANAVAEVGAPTPESTSTAEGMDACLDWCLLRALVTAVPDSALPIRCEEMYSKVVLPLRPAGTTVDIKKSGYKKLAKLFSVWEKKGLITVKPVHKIVCAHCVRLQTRTH